MSAPGAQGVVRYATIFDTSQFEQGTNKIKQSFQQLATGSTTLDSKIKTLNGAFTAGINPIKTQGNALTTLTNNLKTHASQVTTLGSKIKDTASKFAGFATGLSATATGVLQLGAGFRDYSDAQIAVDRSTRKVSLAHEALNKATDKLTKLQHSGSASSKDLAQAQLDVKQAQQQLEIQTQLLGESQEIMFDSQTQFVASVIPTTLGAIGTLGSAFKDLGLNGSKLKGMFDGIGGSAVGLKGKILGIGLAAAGIGLVTDAAIQMADGINKAVMSFDKLAKPVSVLEALSDKSGKRLGQFNQNLKETEILTKAGVTPAMLALDAVFHTHLAEDTLRNAGALDEYNQVIHNTSKWVPLGAKAVSDLGYSFKQTHGPVAITQKDLNMIAGETKSLGSSFDWANTKLIEFNLQWGMAHGVIPKGATDIEKATKNVNNFIGTAQQFINQNLNQTLTEQHDALLKQAVAVGASAKELQGMTDTTGKLNPQIETENKNLTVLINKHGQLTPVQQESVDKAKAQQDAFQKVNDAIQKQQDNVQKITDDWKKFSQEFSKATEITAAFKIKDPGNKFLELFKKALPKKQEHKLELDLKLEAKTANLKEQFQGLLKGVLQPGKLGQFTWDPDLKIDDKAAPKYGKAIITAIDKFFGGHKSVPAEFKGLEEQIKNAIGDKKNVDGAGEKLLAILRAKVEGTQPFKIPVSATLTADQITFLQSGKSRFSNTVGGNKILGLLGLDPMDLKITIPAPTIPKPITTDFDSGVKKATQSVADIGKTVPSITVINKPAISLINQVQKLWTNTAKIHPTIILNTDKALKQIDGIVKRIQDISNLNPTVKVKFTGEGKLQATGSAQLSGGGSIKIAQHGMREILKEDTMILAHKGEMVNIGKPQQARAGGFGGGDIKIELHSHLFDEDIVRKISARQGKRLYTFGA